jgi:hypothetical protein
VTDFIVQLAAGVILMGMSAIGTACLGFISRFKKIKRDLNAAHQKIRRIERKMGYDRDACESGDQPTSEDDY